MVRQRECRGHHHGWSVVHSMDREKTQRMVEQDTRDQRTRLCGCNRHRFSVCLIRQDGRADSTERSSRVP